MVLHEILIALTVTAAVLAATYATLEQGLRTYAIGAVRVESQQAARAALVRLAHEIREAGFGADVDAPLPALAIAEPSRNGCDSSVPASSPHTASSISGSKFRGDCCVCRTRRCGSID